MRSPHSSSGGRSPLLRPANMVHHTIPMNISPAPRASSSSSVIFKKLLAYLGVLCIVGTLVACGSTPNYDAYPRSVPIPSTSQQPSTMPAAPSTSSAADVAGVVNQPKGRWVPVAWTDLPGWGDDKLFEAWNAWLKSCEKPVAPFTDLCGEVRRLSIAMPEAQLGWMRERFQPYRVEAADGEAMGLLTGYFEPILEGSRTPSAQYMVPLYQPPADLTQRKPWFTRQEMDTLPEAQAALKGRAIAYLADPVDALVLQIQGSGRIRIAQPDGSKVLVRLAYAGTNDQPYRSVGRWLLEQGLVKDASWPGIRAWLAQNPQRLQELLWSNPRMTFFKAEPMSELDAAFGPRGSQGVALTPGRSIAVDPGSIPYGAPVWLVSSGSQVHLQKLVLAQDSGDAVKGAVRADYFAGWGSQAEDLAGRLRQPLQLWVLWPK
jgi:membrane-bound lytic murein transglycosylase A